MALFGQKNEEITALSALRTAEDAYCGRLHEAESRNSIRLRSEDGREWLFAAEENALWLFPVLPHLDLPESELNGAKEISLPREQAALRKCEPEIEKIGVEGLFTVYRKPKVRFVMNVPGEGEMRFTGINADRTAEYLAKNGLAQFLAVYDIADCTGPVFAFRCLAGDTLISKEYSRVQVFREGGELVFTSRRQGAYRASGDSIAIGRVPVKAVRFYRMGGGMRTETRVTGGGVAVDRAAAYWSGWAHPFTLNPHGRAIEAAVQSEPIRTEEVQHDERYVQLRVQWENRRADLQFSPDSLAAFDALIPEKEFDELAVSGREPTPVEQLDLLAGLCERGFVTREEFEQAKVRLLGKI